MTDTPLSKAVDEFARVTQSRSKAELETGWAWGAYDSEGVRFAMFRTYEELRELASHMAAQRQRELPQTEAQRLLGLYHQGFRDLQAALIGITPEQAVQPPEEGQWPVTRAYSHIAQADVGFYAVVRYALDRARGGNGQSGEISRDAWEGLIGLTEDQADEIFRRPLSGLSAFYEQHHQRVLDEFASLTEVELDYPSFYWEGYPMPLRFRLLRFDSHLRQHTIQVDETLLAVRGAPPESLRLVRLIYAALAEVEGLALGAAQIEQARQASTAESIAGRAAEIAKL